MNQSKIVQWILRISIAGEFIGHGVFAMQGKQQWIGWIGQMTGASNDLAIKLLFWVGVFDIIIGLVVLFKPVRALLLWAAIWGFWTALVRPLVGEPIWDFIERWANWGAPFALLILIGWPKSLKEWLK